eukprot:CAMPEP_0198534784 /NCGR_PEP_ID=MMETSP1462-20131121/36630_1 /TAXON_ID=1333877 /ORGANISM="Brandtodinium nutriculum, Strain RCC3387" /LENGTH=324 /DNA_ID=CAMNT_0044264709 /DNA_START=68 /DNA_END=1042 /DNA_ORIENTATION=-
MDCAAYGFNVEWFDKQADLIREYTLTLYVPEKGPVEVQMYDLKNRRTFMKRSAAAHLKLEDFRVGAMVTIHARQLKVASYADANTESALSVLHSDLCFCTAPSAFKKAGQIFECLTSAGLRIVRLRLVNKDGPCFAVQVSGSDAEQRWASVQKLLPANSAARVPDVEPFFDRARYPTTAAFDNCTLCIVRPHAVKEGGVGPVLTAIMEAGLEVAALDTLTLPRAMAAELLDVYKGVLPYYMELIDGMSSGPLVAMEIRSSDGACEKLRAIAGPHDVDMARHLRPTSLRAVLGKTNADNGVHATDLEEDGELEVRYIFETVLGGK